MFKIRVISLLAFLFCGFLLNTNYAYTLELDYSDIYITPKDDSSFFSGFVGGNAVGNYDWSIGNGVPFGPRTNDMVFSTYDGSSFQERMRITTSGNVGIDTTSPSTELHVTATEPEITLESSSNLSEDAAEIIALANGVDFRAGAQSFDGLQGAVGTDNNFPLRLYTNNNAVMTLDTSGNVGIGTTSPKYPLEMGSGAYVTTGGVWTNASSRDYKENIRELTAIEAKEVLEELRPTKFNYKVEKDDEYLGFIAEDVPELVATKDRKGLSPMDITAVLTKVAQEQQLEIQEQQNKMDSMEKEIEMLKSTVKQLLEK